MRVTGLFVCCVGQERSWQLSRTCGFCNSGISSASSELRSAAQARRTLHQLTGADLCDTFLPWSNMKFITWSYRYSLSLIIDFVLASRLELSMLSTFV
jgi:hypothetical protein